MQTKAARIVNSTRTDAGSNSFDGQSISWYLASGNWRTVRRTSRVISRAK